MNFPVKNSSEYDGSFPLFRQPTELGCLSMDGDRKFRHDNSQMKYISMPSTLELSLNLSHRYSEAIRKDYLGTEKLDTILRWIALNRLTISRNFRVSEKGNPMIDFICFRGLLTEICATLYEDKDDWLICATKFKSTIYLCAFYTEQRIQRESNTSAREKLMSYWGYKFEQYMTSDIPYGKPVTNVPVNEKEEYDSILKGRLNDHILLYCGEIDGVDPDYIANKNNDPASTNRYIELKTSRIITTDRQNRNFLRFKLLKYWIQSFLVAISKIVVGFRDDDGFVKYLQTFNVEEIPKLAQGMWSPSACLNFCSSFLDFVKRCVIKDNPRVVYKFYRKPGGSITCQELIYPSEYQILPDWYISEMDN